MDLFSKLINDVEDVCKDHIEKGQIISNLKNDTVKNAIIDVISGQKSLEELKQHKFPTLLNESNGILYVHELRNCNKYFLVVWKNDKLDGIIMEYNINATGIVDPETATKIRQGNSKNNDAPSATEDSGAPSATEDN